MTDAKVHYLKPGKATWTPAHVYFLDTETLPVMDGTTEVHALRLWCAKIVDRRGAPDVNRAARWTAGRTAAGLAMSVDNASRHRESLWLYAHNLAFDLATTQLPLRLIELGWEVGDFALSGDNPWLRLSNGKRSLVLADSHAWLPASIADIGRMLGLRKPRLPAWEANEATWRRRCRADVAILADAMCGLMNWHEREGRGWWSVTGTATAWNHMRARIGEKTVVIDPDPKAQAGDRAALYSGRRGCNRVGVFRGRRYLELDLVAAYPTAARVTAAPVRRGRTFDRLDLGSPLLRSPSFGVIAQCRVTTSVPRYPLRVGDAIVYPAGEFDTVLAGPEITDAAARGELRHIGAGQAHQLGLVMDTWAAWVTRLSHENGAETPPIVRLWAKMAGRTVIGRWAAHTWTRTELGTAPGLGWNYEPGIDAVTGLPGGNVDLAGRRWWVQQAEGADNAYPAVTAWIESAVRVAIGRVIDAIGPGAILIVNTDGLVVAETMLGVPAAHGAVEAPAGLTGAARTRWVLERVSGLVAPLSLAVKRSATNVTVLGPQHVIFGAQRKLAGIPSGADETTPGEFSFHAWPGLTWQMQEGDGRGYHRPRVVRTVDGPYPAGWVLDDGTVWPPWAYIGRDNCTHLASWARTPGRPTGRVLAGPQHPLLDALG
jgi:hypothetical protein